MIQNNVQKWIVLYPSQTQTLLTWWISLSICLNQVSAYWYWKSSPIVHMIWFVLVTFAYYWCNQIRTMQSFSFILFLKNYCVIAKDTVVKEPTCAIAAATKSWTRCSTL